MVLSSGDLQKKWIFPTFHSSRFWGTSLTFVEKRFKVLICSNIYADLGVDGPFQSQVPPPRQNRSVRTVETRLSTGILCLLDPGYAARTSAETWDDGVSAWMKGPLLIPGSSDDGERSRDRGGIWFPLQNSKMKTNYPVTLSGDDKSRRHTFIPNWLSQLFAV